MTVIPNLNETTTSLPPITVARAVYGDIHAVTITLARIELERIIRAIALNAPTDLTFAAEMLHLYRREQTVGRRIDPDLARRADGHVTQAARAIASAGEWRIDPDLARTLANHLEWAATEPETCATGRCELLAADGQPYCAGHVTP